MAAIVVRRIAIPEEIAAADTLAEPAYGSAFAVAAPGAYSAEQWARATFEGVPPALRVFVLAAWRFGLGFRLGPRTSPEHVLGCRIVWTRPDIVILEMRSRLMTAHNVVSIDDSGVRWATFVAYRSPFARPLWSVGAVVHHRILCRLLRHAARNFCQSGG